jgi:dolichol kinase
LTIAAGALAIMTLISKPENILASLVILGLGDAASTLVGRRSKRKLAHNRKKTYGGTLAFFIFSLPAFYFAGWQAIIVAALAAAAESFESDIDDNLIIAVVCVIGFRLLGA